MLVTLLLALAVVLVALPWGDLTLAALAGLAGSPRQEGGESPTVPVLALVGLAALAALAGLWSLAGRLGPWPLAAAAGGAVAIGVARRASLAAALRRERAALRAAGALAVLALAAGGLLALGRAAMPVENYDTGAYHAQIIRWLEEYGAVPGLGNIHSRLASSAGWFTPSALFSLAWLGGRSFHVLSAALYLLLLMVALAGFADWRAGSRRAGALLRMALPPAGLFLFGPWLSSPSPDVPVAFLVWICGALFLDGIEAREAQEAGTAGETRRPETAGGLAGPPEWRVLALAVLAGFAVSIKLSAVPLALLPLWLAARQLAAGRARAALVLAGALAATVVPSVLQAIVTCGHLAFPLPGLDVFAFDWEMPRRLVVREYDVIKSWSRVPHRPDLDVLAMPIREWLPLWWDRQKWSAQWAMAAILVLVPARLLWEVGNRLRGRRGSQPGPAPARRAEPLSDPRSGPASAWRAEPRPGPWPGPAAEPGPERSPTGPDRLALVAAAAAGVAFWFLEAPDPRFGWGFLLLLLLLLALPPVAPLLRRRGAGALAAALLVFFIWHAREVNDWEPGSFQVAARHAVLPADYPVPATRPAPMRGFVALAPVRRDQCWYRPFPCTPFPDPRIEMRGRSLGDGFRFVPGAPGQMETPTWHAAEDRGSGSAEPERTVESENPGVTEEPGRADANGAGKAGAPASPEEARQPAKLKGTGEPGKAKGIGKAAGLRDPGGND